MLLPSRCHRSPLQPSPRHRRLARGGRARSWRISDFIPHCRMRQSGMKSEIHGFILIFALISHWCRRRRRRCFCLPIPSTPLPSPSPSPSNAAADDDDAASACRSHRRRSLLLLLLLLMPPPTTTTLPLLADPIDAGIRRRRRRRRRRRGHLRLPDGDTSNS
jgi:hypothetical protein